MMTSLCKSKQFFWLLVMAVASLAWQDGKTVIKVGDKIVNGKNIQPYSAIWTLIQQTSSGDWRQVSTIEETLRSETIDGKSVMVREQVARPSSGGREKVETLFFDAATLEPMKWTLKAKGSFPPRAPKEGQVEYKGRLVHGNMQSFEGKTKEIDHQLNEPMFETGMLGLIIAALPLKEGFEVQLPSIFVTQGSKWSITLRVVGRETYFTSNGERVDTWVVNTDWADMDSDYVSKGGANDEGGAFSVTPNPPEGFPYVARYVNKHVDIKVITEMKESE